MRSPLPFATAPAATARTAALPAFRGLRAAVRRWFAGWRRPREAARMAAELRGVDPRVLRDVGLDRSEIDSVVAEITGAAPRTRVAALRVWRHLTR